MKKLILVCVVALIVLSGVLTVSTQTVKKNKSKARSVPAASTNVDKPSNGKRNGSNYIGETEKGKMKRGNNAVFEPNDANTRQSGSAPSTSPGTANPNAPANQIFDTFDPGWVRGSRRRPEQPGTSPAEPDATAPTIPKAKPTTKGLTGGTVIVSSKVAKPKPRSAKARTRRNP